MKIKIDLSSKPNEELLKNVLSKYEITEEDDFDLLITDIKKLKENFDKISEVRKGEAVAPVLIIDRADARKLIEMGYADDYIRTPVDKAELLAIIENLLRIREKFVELKKLKDTILNLSKLLAEIIKQPVVVFDENLNMIYQSSAERFDVSKVRELAKKVVESGKPVNEEIELDDKHYLVSASPLIRDGKIVMIVSIAFDKTERVKAERELKKTASQLSENVEIFAVLVDKIRNPLAAAMAYLEIYEINEEVEEKIRRQLERVVEVIEDIEKSWKNSEEIIKFIRKTMDEFHHT